MAIADQVKALICSHADGDDTRFDAVAMQVAAQAARSGHGRFAQELRDLADQAKARTKAVEAPRGVKPVPLAQPRVPGADSQEERAMREQFGPVGALLSIQAGTSVHFAGVDLSAAGIDTDRIEPTINGLLTVHGSPSEPRAFFERSMVGIAGTLVRYYPGDFGKAGGARRRHHLRCAGRQQCRTLGSSTNSTSVSSLSDTTLRCIRRRPARAAQEALR